MSSPVGQAGRPRVAVIAAVAANGVIGRGGELPWRLPADLARFKRLTMGHHLIMGRRTYESIGRPLPGRTSVVLTRGDWSADGVVVVHDADAALAACAGDDEVFVIGGADVFELFLPRADRLYLTRLHEEIAGDVVFPPLDETAWRLVRREDHEADERNRHAYSFLDYARHGGAQSVVGSRPDPSA